MSILLTEQQQQALDSEEERPVQVLDPRTDSSYVLLPLTDYEAVQDILEDERSQRELHSVALLNAARRLDEET
jgi:hypothetical protein